MTFEFCLILYLWTFRMQFGSKYSTINMQKYSSAQLGIWITQVYHFSVFFFSKLLYNPFSLLLLFWRIWEICFWVLPSFFTYQVFQNNWIIFYYIFWSIFHKQILFLTSRYLFSPHSVHLPLLLTWYFSFCSDSLFWKWTEQIWSQTFKASLQSLWMNSLECFLNNRDPFSSLTPFLSLPIFFISNILSLLLPSQTKYKSLSFDLLLAHTGVLSGLAITCSFMQISESSKTATEDLRE